ncbi:MAG: protoporphyrinogen oxidase HemJ [Tatlockia sp.]|nr:protoporphyrinogen oxidase HemJ [Tatlockia sp.]
MLYIKAFHIIAMVAWFAGLFYLPRLFVYHAEASDALSITRFKVMERRLYYGITWPAALATVTLGLILISYNLSYYLNAVWLQGKLALVFVLCIYHLGCGYFLKRFTQDKNTNSARFYRFYNEVPTILLFGIIMLVVIKPV